MNPKAVLKSPDYLSEIRQLISEPSPDKLLRATQVSGQEWSRLLDVVYLEDETRCPREELVEFDQLLNRCRQLLGDLQGNSAAIGAVRRLEKYGQLVGIWLRDGVDALRVALEALSPEPLPVRNPRRSPYSR